MSRTVQIGLDLGRESMLAAVIHRGEEPIVTGLWHSSVCHATDSSEEGVIEVLGHSLKRYLDAEGLRGAPTVFSVPSELATFHWTRLPRARAGDLSDIATFQLRDQLPAGSSVGVVPFGNASDEYLEALVIGVPFEWVARRARWLESLGLEPIACEVEAQSLLRVVQRELAGMTALFRELSMTVVHLGPDRTRFIVMQNRRLQFVRTVRFGTNRLVKAILDAQGGSAEEARAMLDDPGCHLTREGLLISGHQSVDLSETLESLEKELRRLLNYFRTLKSDRSYSGLLERLVMTGDAVGLPGFSDYVGKRLGVRTQTIDPLRGMSLAVDAPTFGKATAASHRYAVATGLALSEYPCPTQGVKSAQQTAESAA